MNGLVGFQADLREALLMNIGTHWQDCTGWLGRGEDGLWALKEEEGRAQHEELGLGGNGSFPHGRDSELRCGWSWVAGMLGYPVFGNTDHTSVAHLGLENLSSNGSLHSEPRSLAWDTPAEKWGLACQILGS